MSAHPNPRSLLLPAMRGVLDRMARAGRPPMHALTPQQARIFYEAGANVLDIAPHKMAQVEALQLPMRDGTLLEARLVVPYRTHPKEGLEEPLLPDAEPWPVLLYLHGGGFTVGSINTHDSLCRHLGHLAHCAVLSVNYRLAPEHRFPTAVNDAWDAFQWLHLHAPDWGLDARRIAVGGDSAGGTLSMVTALMARDAGLGVALQLLFYPGCASNQNSGSHRTFGHGFLLETPGIDWFFGQYLNDPTEREDWRFAPLNAPDLEGVAPVWMGLAECDPLVDEGVLMADRFRWAGVPVDLEIYAGVTHEFIKMGRAIPVALQAHQDAARALRKAFNAAGCAKQG
jgi:acetyl esterase